MAKISIFTQSKDRETKEVLPPKILTTEGGKKFFDVRVGGSFNGSLRYYVDSGVIIGDIQEVVDVKAQIEKGIAKALAELKK
jgi:hypothetical protein